MIISIYALAEPLNSKEVYFSIGDSKNGKAVFSPLYKNEKACIQAIRQLILSLRAMDKDQQDNAIHKTEDGFEIHLMAEDAIPFKGQTIFNNKEETTDFLTTIRRDSKADLFSIYHFEQNFENDKNTSLPEPDRKPIKTSTLNLSKQKASTALAAAAINMPAASLMATQPCAPLFNLLRPYGKADINRFFGRETETEDLYEQTFDTRLLVVYGERSVGKTSLVQCGLANRLPAEKWHDLYIRRWLNINGSLKSTLYETATKLGCQEVSKDTNPMDALRAIYLQTFQPVLLVFDQLEELFTLPYSPKEQQEFFLFLQELIQDTTCPAKVILIIRDEYLAKLADYETIVPTLLEHRFHLKHLSSTALKVVVNGLLGQLVSSGKIRLEDPELVTQKIQDNLAGDKPSVGLACTQVYLHQAHQMTCRSMIDRIPVFSPALFDKIGKSDVAIRSYVDNKIALLEKDLPGDQGPVLKEEQAQEIEDLMQMQNACGCPETEARSIWLAKWHERGQEKKQLSWFLRLSIFGLLFSAIASGITYCSLAKQDPCLLAQEAGNCEARINYLCHNGTDSDCADHLINLLDREDCPVWIDYKAAMLTNSCESYRVYINTYRAQGVCLDKFYQILADRNCPTATDTITKVIVNIDTVYQKVYTDGRPPDYEKLFPKNQPLEKKPNNECVVKFGNATLKLGPLFMMTSDLEQGTQYDWVGALAACKRLGPNWRLPCAGEIDFILDKHYLDATSAYQNLTNGPCPIFTTENAAISGSFWTATEANDKQAWSIFFDTKNAKVRMITGTDKNTTLPCRCVYRDPEVTSGIPDCLEKQIYRPNK